MNIKSINKVKYFLFLFCFFILSNYSCQKNSDEKKVRVDFSRKEEIISLSRESGSPLMAAVSPLISS